MTCVRLADSGAGDSHAVYREQELNPPRPWLPDPPAGVVRLWLPALVSSPASTILAQFIDLSEGGVCVSVCLCKFISLFFFSFFFLDTYKIRFVVIL